MSVWELLLLWEQAEEVLDGALDWGDYDLANSVRQYLNFLALEIELFAAA